MLYDYMDEHDQLCHLLEKIEDIIREYNFDEDIGLMPHHRDLIRAVFFDSKKLENGETKEKYKREFNGHDYVYGIIYENEALRELQRKIRYGYFNEESYEFFKRKFDDVLYDIYWDFGLIFDTNSLFDCSIDEFTDRFNRLYPYMNVYDILDIKMHHLMKYNSDEDIKKLVKNLDYKTEFLYSPYWRWVRHQKLICFGNKCELCGNRKKLHIHHRKYDNHGLEHKWEIMYKDLMIACECCHNKIHGYALTEPI